MGHPPDGYYVATIDNFGRTPARLTDGMLWFPGPFEPIPYRPSFGLTPIKPPSEPTGPPQTDGYYWIRYVAGGPWHIALLGEDTLFTSTGGRVEPGRAVEWGHRIEAQ